MCMQWELWFEALEQRRQQSRAHPPRTPVPSAKAEPRPTGKPQGPLPPVAEPEPV